MRRCPRCRYDLEGLPDAHQCPECGFEYDPSMLFLEAWGWKGRPKWYRAIGLAVGLVAMGAGLIFALLLNRTGHALVYLCWLLLFVVSAWKWFDRMRIARQGGSDCSLIVTDRGVEISRSAGRVRRLNWAPGRPPSLYIDDDGLHLELRPRSLLWWLTGIWPERVLVGCDRARARALREQIEERYTRATGRTARRTSFPGRRPSRHPLPPGGFSQWG